MDNLKDEFRSERLLYRGIETEDAAWIYQNIHSSSVTQALGASRLMAPFAKGKDEDYIKRFQEGLLGVLICLVPPEGGGEPQRIGTMGLIVPGYAGVANPHRRCELGITLAPQFQNKGYGTEAIIWVVDWAFRFANMHCVCLKTISFNTRGQRVYEKVGFKLEGRVRHWKWHDKQWHDQLLYSILEDEWEEIQKERNGRKDVKEIS